MSKPKSVRHMRQFLRSVAAHVGLMRIGESKSVQHMRIIGKHDEWSTPPDLYEWACKRFGVMPAMDVCANDDTVAKCRLHITPKNDGLGQHWPVDFFCNPPYSEVKDWVGKAISEVNRNNVTGLLLTFAKTDVRWWHEHIEGNGNVEVHFHNGRIKFWRNGKPGPSAAPYPSVWIVIRPKTGSSHDIYGNAVLQASSANLLS